MKKPRVPLPVLLTCVFAAFTLGLYAGRNRDSQAVTLRELPAPTALVGSQHGAYPVNINTADAETLQLLPGIGPALAGRILDYRAQRRPFETPGELALVNGIGEIRLEQLWDLITVGG